MGPILCVAWAGTNEATGRHAVEIVGYPVQNWTKKHLPPRDVNYNHESFRKVIQRSERIKATDSLSNAKSDSL